MKVNKLLSTDKLKDYIENEYQKAKSVLVKYGVYRGLDIMYMKNTSNSPEGEYVFSDNQGYHYVYSERGTENMHKITDDLFEISYWVLNSIISSIAFDYELKHRIPNQDCRRIAFKMLLELLDYIGSNYHKRGEIEIDRILKANPYNDKI